MPGEHSSAGMRMFRWMNQAAPRNRPSLLRRRGNRKAVRQGLVIIAT